MPSDPFAPEAFPQVQPFHVWDNAFTPSELDSIEAHGDSLTLNKGTLLSDGPEVTYDALRIAREAEMKPAPETLWLYQRIERVIRALNQQAYKFDVMGFAEPFRYLVYDGGEGGHFGWHVDNGRLAQPRKLSATLQLTDGAAYEGCDLEFFGTHQIETAPRNRGALVIFPSYVLHRVTPIRAGMRKALVIWSTGPNFR
jgi:PKHD-type hydroxylase